MIAFLARRIRTGDPRVISFEAPPEWEGALRILFERCKKHHEDAVHLTLGTPRKARSVGRGSQNNGIRGWCGEIADQMSTPDEAIDPEDVYQAMKRIAVGELGYPTVLNPVDGKEEPISISQASTEQASMVIRVVKRFADEHGFYLTEIVEGRPMRLLGGKVPAKSKENP